MSLQEGVDHFNCGSFWEAHESWERLWLNLALPEKLLVQAFIQAAGAFYLDKIGRPSGALSLAASSLNKFEELRQPLHAEKVEQLRPKIVADGIEDCLRQMIQEGRAGKIPLARLLC